MLKSIRHSTFVKTYSSNSSLSSLLRLVVILWRIYQASLAVQEWFAITYSTCILKVRKSLFEKQYSISTYCFGSQYIYSTCCVIYRVLIIWVNKLHNIPWIHKSHNKYQRLKKVIPGKIQIFNDSIFKREFLACGIKFQLKTLP